MKTVFFFLALCALPHISHAQSLEDWRLHAHGDHIDVVNPEKSTALRLFVLEEVSAPTRDQAIDAGEAAIRRWTKSTAAEVCAMLCQNPRTGAFGMTVVTAQSHLACPVFRICPKGMEATPEQTDFHSHGSKSRFRINRADTWLTGETPSRVLSGGTSKFHFSPADRIGPPSYLITPKGREFSSGTNDIERGPELTHTPSTRRCLRP